MNESCGTGGGAGPFYGKYRGKVLDNVDPLFQGRIMADVPSVQGSLTNWAMPCTPYAGKDVGFYAIPPVGANVWIEFEGGDPNYPIWAGCFWGPTDVLHVPEPPPPEVKVFQTEHVTMVLSDVPELGGFTLQCKTPAVNELLTMKFDAEGIQVLCPEAAITMTPETITLTVPESVVTLTAEDITATVPPGEISVSPETISIAIPASTITLTEGSIVSETPELNITAMTQVEGETNIAPALTVEGEENVTGALTAEGEVNALGALTAEGEVNALGAVTTEGEVNMAGMLTVEGAILEDGAPVMVIPI